MRIYFKKLINEKPKLRKFAGIILIILGILVYIVPFVPSTWMIFVGLEFLGVKMIFQNKIKLFFQNKIKKILKK